MTEHPWGQETGNGFAPEEEMVALTTMSWIRVVVRTPSQYEDENAAIDCSIHGDLQVSQIWLVEGCFV